MYYVQHTSLTILGPEWPQPAPAVSLMRATESDGGLQSAGRIVASAVALAAVVLAWVALEAEAVLAVERLGRQRGHRPRYECHV